MTTPSDRGEYPYDYPAVPGAPPSYPPPTPPGVVPPGHAQPGYLPPGYPPPGSAVPPGVAHPGYPQAYPPGYPPGYPATPAYAYPPPQWGAPGMPYPVVQAKQTNPFAIASLICSLVGVIPFFGIVGVVLGIVFGFVARAQIRHTGGVQEGSGLAVAGIIIGFVITALWVVALVGLSLASHNTSN